MSLEIVGAVATGFQAIGSIMQGSEQAVAYKYQAKVADENAKLTQVETGRRVAMEKASAAEAALERTRELQRIVGATLVRGGQAGVSTFGSNVINALAGSAGGLAAEDERSANLNLNNRLASINLNAAVDTMNSKMAAASYRSQASMSRMAGYTQAIGTLGSYAMRQQARGEVPE
jgi:hypothetical protein